LTSVIGIADVSLLQTHCEYSIVTQQYCVISIQQLYVEANQRALQISINMPSIMDNLQLCSKNT